jgi:Yip1 domain
MTNAVTDDVVGTAGPADMAEIFYAPRAVFARRRAGGFGLPLVVLAVLAGVFSFATSSLTQPAMHADMIRGMQPAIAAGKMTPEAAAATTAMTEKLAPVLAVAFFLITPFVVGVISWVIAKIAGVKQEIGVAVMVATFSMFPRLVGVIAGAVMAAMTPDGELISGTKLSLSPARFVDPTVHAGLAQLLTRFDLFILWAYVLVGIGVYVTGRSTKVQAIAAAAGTWVVLSIPAVLGYLRAS